MSLTFTFRDGTTTTDTLEWARKYEDNDYRRVALDEFSVFHQGSVEHNDMDVTTHWRVSTIWEGMPSLGLGDGRPRIYETAIFRNEELVGEIHHETEAQAVGAHADILDALKATNSIHEIPDLEM